MEQLNNPFVIYGYKSTSTLPISASETRYLPCLKQQSRRCSS